MYLLLHSGQRPCIYYYIWGKDHVYTITFGAKTMYLHYIQGKDHIFTITFRAKTMYLILHSSQRPYIYYDSWGKEHVFSITLGTYFSAQM